MVISRTIGKVRETDLGSPIIVRSAGCLSAADKGAVARKEGNIIVLISECSIELYTEVTTIIKEISAMVGYDCAYGYRQNICAVFCCPADYFPS